MSSGWIILFEVAVVLGLAVSWAFYELKTLKKLRLEREAAAKRERTEPPPVAD